MADKKKMVEIPVNTPIGKGGRASIEKVPAGGEKHKRYLKSKNNPDSPFFVREGFSRGDRVNTSRENRLEELGRVDAEKAYTSKGKRNLKDEKKRIVRELKAGGGLIKGKPKLAKKGWK